MVGEINWGTPDRMIKENFSGKIEIEERRKQESAGGSARCFEAYMEGKIIEPPKELSDFLKRQDFCFH